MKKRIFAFALVTTLVLSCAIIANAASMKDAKGNTVDVVGSNLIANPSFESAIGGEWWADPNYVGGWTLWGMRDGNVNGNGGAADGGVALNLRVNADNDNWATLKQVVDVKAGKTYIFNAYLKATDGNTFAMDIHVYDGDEEKYSFMAESVKGSNNFEQVSAIFQVPEGLSNPRLGVFAGNGTYDEVYFIDNVSVYEVADPSKVTVDYTATGSSTVEGPTAPEELDTTLKGAPADLPADALKVYLDYNYVPFDVAPFIQDGRTFIGVRGLLEQMGAQVGWDDATRTVTLTTAEKIITLVIDNPVITINNADGSTEAVGMDVAPFIKDGRTVVPLRFASEALGKTVEWFEDTKSVSIY